MYFKNLYYKNVKKTKSAKAIAFLGTENKTLVGIKTLISPEIETPSPTIPFTGLHI